MLVPSEKTPSLHCYNLCYVGGKRVFFNGFEPFERFQEAKGGDHHGQDDLLVLNG